MDATGGDSVYTDTVGTQEYQIHEFTNDGTFSVTEAGNIDYIVVGGGGGGGGESSGGASSGGGGGGGIVYVSGHSVSSGDYNINIGYGGSGGSSSSNGYQGGDSSAFGTTAYGGGGGSEGNSGVDAPTYDGNYGGGGGACDEAKGAPPTDQGNAGGGYDDYDSLGGIDGHSDGVKAGGGGQGGQLQQGGAGGDGGDYSDKFGTTPGENGYFAGGGAGGSGESSTLAYGGLGGGANGSTGGTGGYGTDGTGGGGGGGEANSGGGNGGDGVVVIRYENVSAPSTPQNLTSTVSQDDISLDWDAVSWNNDQEHYNVYRGQASGNHSWIADVQPGTTTYTDSGLEDGERYYYVVDAENSAGYSGDSNETNEITYLPAPTLNSLDTSVEDEISVNWSKNDDSGDGDFYVYRSQDGTLGTSVATVSSSTTSYTDTGLEDGEKYYYTIRRSTDHNSSDSGQSSATTYLPAPSNLSATNS